MKKLKNRVISILMCLLLVIATPAMALADTVEDTSAQTAASEETGTSEEVTESQTYTSSSSESETTDEGSSDVTDALEEIEDTESETGNDYAALNEAILQAEALSESNYKADSWSTLQTALSAAKEALSSTDQDEIDAAVTALTDAIGALVSLTETKTTYSLSMTVSTTAVSSSNSAVKKVSVSRPKITTTVTNVYSDASTEVVSKTTKTYTLTLQVHVRGYSWNDGSLNSAGTTYSYTASKASSGNYIQAVRIKPSSSLKSAMSAAGITYYYRAKTEYWGTMGWAAPGKSAGSSGNNNPMTGIELKICTTSEAKSLDTSDRYITATTVSYKTRLTGASSWGSVKKSGSTSGSTSAGKSIGSLAVKISRNDTDFSYSGSIKYSIRTTKSDSSSNWSSYKSNYSTAGSKNSKIRAIKIQLTGEMAEKYDVYYRVYISGYGWMGWAKNGQKAGTSGTTLNISAVQVKLVAKGADAPGSTSNRFLSGSNAKVKMVVKAQSFTSSTKYLILVDRSNCKVGIFTGKKNNWSLKYYWSCCVGKSSTPTISGSYKVGIKLYSFGESKGYSCYYATQISGNYLFHSVLYYPNTRTIKDGTMGKAVSHGCVRLTIEHAKWIYDNIGKNTKVYIY